jgi:hypothetical protein
MPIPSLRRRIGKLEGVAMFVTAVDYPPLTSTEIEGIASRFQTGKLLRADEVARLERQSPIVEGELLITAHRGNVFIKRYPGVDLAEL